MEMNFFRNRILKLKFFNMNETEERKTLHMAHFSSVCRNIRSRTSFYPMAKQQKIMKRQSQFFRSSHQL